jgi:hypothetical protein
MEKFRTASALSLGGVVGWKIGFSFISGARILDIRTSSFLPSAGSTGAFGHSSAEGGRVCYQDDEGVLHEGLYMT